MGGSRLPKGALYMKKIIALFFVLFLSFSVLSKTTLAAESQYNIDFSKTGQGIVRILYKSEKDVKVKLMIIKGKEKYTYNLKSNEEYINFPLQLGNGKYVVNIYENTTGKKYKKVFCNSADVNITDNNQVFLNSVQSIEWNNNDEAIKLATNIIEDNIELSDRDKVTAIYQYIVKNISYDNKKAENLKYDYLPNIDSTLKSGTGICYDYASLLASMLRSASIPTKLVKGYSAHTDVYHAWNEIYIADENKWIVVDATYDAFLYNNNKKYSLEKKASEYKSAKEY
jgi:hypothetical protein